MQRVLAFGAALLVCLPGAADTTFTPLGARATGLGGAYTAVADDVTAFHWNPAGVARGRKARLGFYAGEAEQDRGDTVSRIQAEQTGQGSQLTGDRAWGVAAGLTVLGVAVSRFTHTQSILEGTTVRSRGLRTWDVAATFVQSLPPDDLIIGLNARFIRGTAYSDEIPGAEIPDDERNGDDLGQRAVSSAGRSESEPGIDLGVVYQPTGWIRLGIDARNLNRPTFHTEAGEPISLERHTRAGVAFFPPGGLLVAFDIDVSSRDDPGLPEGWRELAWGVEKTWRGRALAVRGGVRSELSGGGLHHTGFAAGAGWVIKGFNLEVAALTSPHRRVNALWLGVSYAR